LRLRTLQTPEGEREIEIGQVRPAAETFASRLFPRTPKLLRTEPLKALVIGAFVRVLSMRDVESLCDEAGLGKLSKATVSRMCEKLKERFEWFRRRDLYEIRQVALFLEATFIAVRPDGPKESVLVAWGFTEAGDACCYRWRSGCARASRTGRRSAAISSRVGWGRRC
jgi:transposase-like protein